MSNRVEGTVISQEHRTGQQYALRMRAKLAPVEAGQFAELALAVGGDMVARAYTFVDAPHERPQPRCRSAWQVTGKGRSVRHFLKFALLLLALIGLAGCSGVRLAYNNADTVVRWMADDYFGLEGAQEEDFKARLARFHAWHRSEELPLYGALLNRSGDKIADGLSSEVLLWAWDSVKGRYRHMAVHAAPELAAVLSTLTPAQFERLDKKFSDSNAEFAKKHIKGGEVEQRKRRSKRNLELMREWFGDLSDEQEAQLKAWSDKMPLLYTLRLQNRQLRQQEFVALLKQYRSPAELAPRLRRWLLDWEDGASPGYRKLSGIHQEQYIQMLLELDRGLTPTQREHAVTRMREHAEIFNELAAAGRKGQPGPSTAGER